MEMQNFNSCDITEKASLVRSGKITTSGIFVQCFSPQTIPHLPGRAFSSWKVCSDLWIKQRGFHLQYPNVKQQTCAELGRGAHGSQPDSDEKQLGGAVCSCLVQNGVLDPTGSTRQEQGMGRGSLLRDASSELLAISGLGNS